MKFMKKISAALLTLCLVIPCFSMVANAADGKISFSDPQTKVGDMVEVKCAVRTTSGTLGNVKVDLSYDSSALRFESGDGVEKTGDGALTCTGDGGSSEQIFMLNFQALKEGSTQVTISGSTIADTNGTTLSLDSGNSTVTIGAGDPSKIKEETDSNTQTSAEDVQVEVDGTTYTLTGNFSDADIPDGYERTEVELEGQNRQMVVNETSGVTLGYLVGGDTADFFYFNTENATFSPYEELRISDTASIVLLSDTSQVNLPETYKEAEYSIDGKTFPVWQESGEEDFYVLYAINSSTGETGYYKYDVAENTYQRFVPVDDTEEKDEPKGLLKKIQDFIETYIQKIVLFGGLGAIAILLLIIILAIKLHNRNVELDELYDEYGIDEEEEPEERPAKKGFGFGKNKKDEFEDDFEDEFEDDYEDDFEDEFEDDFENDFVTEEIGFGSSDEEYIDEDFPTEDFGFFADENFDTDGVGYIDEDFPTEEIDLGYEEDFSAAQNDYDNGDFLDDVDTDEFVVYGGQSRTEELTIDDLDELLGNQSKKKEEQNPDATFKMDFIDLD